MGTIKSANYRKPAYLLILLDILGFGLLYISKSYNMNVVYTGIAVLVLFLVMYTVLVICRMGDKFIMLMAFMLMSIGVLLLCRINLDYGFRQIIWILVGGAAFFVAYFIYYNIKIWDRFWYILFCNRCRIVFVHPGFGNYYKRLKELGVIWTYYFSALRDN